MDNGEFPDVVFVVIDMERKFVRVFSRADLARRFVEIQIWPQNYDIVECEVDA